MDHTKKPSPNTGKVAAEPSEGASVTRKVKTAFYKTTLNTCPSFSNEVMASEPLFEERSDAVKVSETLCLWLRWRRQPSEGASWSRN